MRTAEPSARAVLRIVAIVVLAAVALWLIYLLRKPIGWLFLAAFVAVGVSAPVNLLARRVPRGLAIALVYLTLIGLPILLIALVVPPLITQGVGLAEDLPRYAGDVQRFLQENDQLRRLDDKYDIGAQLQSQAAKIPDALGSAAGVLSDLGLGLVNSVFALVNILILSIFMVAGGPRWTTAALRLAPIEQQARLLRVAERIVNAVSGYVQGALLIAVIAGTTTFVVLSILGVAFALPLAVMAGAFSLIPLVGATAAAVIIGIVTLFDDFPTATVVWAIWAIVYQQVENNLIQPQVQRRTVAVQPIVVLVAVLFGSTLLGVVGAFVAIPIAATIQIALQELWQLRAERQALATAQLELGIGDAADA
jgi:predicted PurR-regulated permease PerM